MIIVWGATSLALLLLATVLIGNGGKNNTDQRPLPKVNYMGQVNLLKQHLNNTPRVKIIEHSGNTQSHFISQEVAVKFTKHPDEQEVARIEKEIDGRLKKHLDNTCIFASDSKNTTELIQYFNRRTDVEYAEPNYILLPNAIPNDQYYRDYQWNLPIIGLESGWDISEGSENVIVAVVDTGVDLEHPDFQGQLVQGYNVVEDTNNPDDDNGHGTHVAGIISAATNNGEGIAGISWYSKIMPIKGIGSDGSGTAFDIASGIRWAVDHGASVINLSVGNYTPSDVLHEAVRYAFDRDVVLVSASGNDNTQQPGYPAAYPEVLAVGAVDYTGQRASFSNFGDYLDVVAPGVDIASTFPDNQYAALSGTSMASPHVAGLAALLRAANPDLTNQEIMDILRYNSSDGGTQGKDAFYGYGLVNSAASLQAVIVAAQPPGPSSTERPNTPIFRRLLQTLLEQLGLITRGT